MPPSGMMSSPEDQIMNLIPFRVMKMTSIMCSSGLLADIRLVVPIIVSLSYVCDMFYMRVALKLTLGLNISCYSVKWVCSTIKTVLGG